MKASVAPGAVFMRHSSSIMASVTMEGSWMTKLSLPGNRSRSRTRTLRAMVSATLWAMGSTPSAPTSTRPGTRAGSRTAA